LKGLISGEMRCYWLQNDPANFEAILQKFIICLTERGHQLQGMLPLFQQAARLINSQHTQQESRDNHNIHIYPSEIPPQGPPKEGHQGYI